MKQFISFHVLDWAEPDKWAMLATDSFYMIAIIFYNLILIALVIQPKCDALFVDKKDAGNFF